MSQVIPLYAHSRARIGDILRRTLERQPPFVASRGTKQRHHPDTKPPVVLELRQKGLTPQGSTDSSGAP